MEVKRLSSLIYFVNLGIAIITFTFLPRNEAEAAILDHGRDHIPGLSFRKNIHDDMSMNLLINDITSLNKDVSKYLKNGVESSERDTNSIMSDGVSMEKEEEDLDSKVFEDGKDMAGALEKVYLSLSGRLSSLKSKVNNIEKVTNDILARLTIVDCSDLKKTAHKAFKFHLDHHGKRPVAAACDQTTDGGGWTIIQQRLSKKTSDHISKATSFDRNWHDYKMGFGTMDNDYWVGLENIHIWTNTRHYELRIELSDFEGDTAFAHYDRFYIDGESNNYRLHVFNFSGTAGDSLTGVDNHDDFTANGMMFSTKDRDNDNSFEINCSEYWAIGGWWFNKCSWANLNGPYKLPTEGDGIGINWHKWRNKKYIRSVVMMIRPVQNP